MSDPKLGRRYADGLYNAALNGKIVAEMMEAMEAIHGAFDSIPELDRYWRGYKIAPQQKKELINKAFAEAPAIVINFLCFLVDKKREAILPDVFRSLTERHDAEQDIVRAILTTATELEDAEADKFVELLKQQVGGDIRLTRKVDPSLVAGFRLRHGNRVIDASVERSIKEIRRKVGA